MSSNADQARLIADRIAKRVSSPAAAVRSGASADISSELAAMRASLSELQNRLIQIESKVSSSNAGYSSGVATPHMHSPWLAGVNASHPESGKIRCRRSNSLRTCRLTFRVKRLAPWNPVANLATTVRCAARGASSRHPSVTPSNK